MDKEILYAERNHTRHPADGIHYVAQRFLGFADWASAEASEMQYRTWRDFADNLDAGVYKVD